MIKLSKDLTLSDNFQKRAIDAMGRDAAHDLIMALATGQEATPPESPVFSGTITMVDGTDIDVGTIVGTVLATNPGQKLGVWGATPVVQPTSPAEAAIGGFVTQVLTGMVGVPAIAIPDVGAAYDQLALNNIVASLAVQINNVVTDLTTIKTLVNQIRSDLVTIGIIKGS